MESKLREQEAAEIVRRRQQGFGKPIISLEHSEFRLVCIGSKICWSKNWLYFTDFLLDHLKDVLGREWGRDAQARGIDHPIFRWLAMLRSRVGVVGTPSKGVREIGYITSLFRLAYALYLIAHHDLLAPSLIKRLQNHRDEVFRPAMYETLVAAAFAVAGFKIEGAEHVRTSRKTPEFWAVSSSGKKYAVEAKCKQSWKSRLIASDPEFQQELSAWIRGKLYDASKKKLAAAVFWLELSIPEQFGQQDYLKVREVIANTLVEAENLTVDGEPTDPAYVFVTNHSHMVSDLVEGSPFFAVLEGYRKPDMKAQRWVSLEEAFDIRDRHREISRVFECFSEVQRIPQTFGGEPVEFMNPNGDVVRTLKIGSPIHLDFPDGASLSGILREIAVANDIACVIIETPSGQQRLATMPLSEAELKVARQYGMAAFGKPEGPMKDLGNDPVKLYDWLLETFAAYPAEALMRQIPGHGYADQIAALPIPEMRKRVAREVAKRMHADSMQRQSPGSFVEPG